MSPDEDGNDSKATPLGDRLDLIPGGNNCVRGTLAHQVGGYVFPSPEGAVLMTSPPETGDGNRKSPPPSIVGLLVDRSSLTNQIDAFEAGTEGNGYAHLAPYRCHLLIPAPESQPGLGAWSPVLLAVFMG